MLEETPTALAISMYRTMVRIRLFEETVADHVADKEIQTTCHLYQNCWSGQKCNRVLLGFKP